MLEKLLGGIRFNRLISYIPISALASILGAYVPQVSASQITPKSHLSIEESVETFPHYDFNSAYKDYKQNPSPETLEKALEISDSAFRYFLKEGSSKIRDFRLAARIFNELSRIRTVNNNFESNISSLLKMFDDESFRLDFIRSFANTEAEQGGYIRKRGGRLELEILQVHDEDTAEVKQYLNEFKSGNFRNRKYFLKKFGAIIDGLNVGLSEEESKVFKGYVDQLHDLLFRNALLSAYIKNPGRTKNSFKDDPQIIDYLNKTSIKEANEMLQESLNVYDDVEMMINSRGTLTPVGEIKQISEVIASWHTHPYNKTARTTGLDYPHPPRGPDLQVSVSNGHHLVFGFGKDSFAIYAIKYGKPSVLGEYKLTPDVNPN